MPMQNGALEATTTELATLAGCSIHALRDRWHSIFRSKPPPAFGPDLLRRSIAQKLQEDAFGKLPSAAQQELSRIVASLKKDPTARIELPRRIKPGAVLVRDWKGKSKRVMVLDKGFAYEGRTYQSLSEIAREITGTRWNGPKFFGLRPTERPCAGDLADAAPRKRGRPPKSSLAVKPSTQTEASNGL